MDFEIIEIENLSGEKAVIYSVIEVGCEIDLFRQFLTIYLSKYPNEIAKISTRLRVIGNATGAREDFFKHDEGELADGVCAIFDDPDRKMRLYCIRYGNGIVVVGNGGPKPKNIRRWQDCPILSKAAYQMIEVAKKINERIRDGDIDISQNKMTGNLVFREK